MDAKLPNITQEMIDDDASDLINDVTAMSKNTILKYINNIVKTMNTPCYLMLKKKNNELYEKQMTQLFHSFSKRYPGLFKMILNSNNDINYEMLGYMLDKMEQIKSREITRFNASSEIGKTLFDQFIPKE